MSNGPRDTTAYHGSIDLITPKDGGQPQFLVNGVPIQTGSIANTVVVESKSDLPSPSGGVITLAVASYAIKGDIDLNADRIFMVGGSQIIGDTATLSSLTSSSTSPTITVGAGGFAACSISGNGGLKVNNTGGGAAIRAEDADTILAIRRLFTSACGTALEINNAGVLLDSWTILNGVNGIVMTGAANVGPIINNFNPIGLTGKGIYIDGDIISNALRINDAIMGATTNFPNNAIQGNAVEIASGRTIQGMSFSGDAISNTGNGIKIAGDVDGGLLLDKTNILSFQNDGMDITGATFSSFIASDAGITATAAGKFGLKGDAASANITTGAGICSTCFIDGTGAGGGPLSGIAKTDIKWQFTNAGPAIVDSTDLGGFTLDAQSTTTVLVINDWYKINGATTDIATIERFIGSADNELESLESKTIPIVYSAVLSGQKTGGGADLFQIALYKDSGGGFVQVNGEVTFEADARTRSTTIIVPTEASEGDKFTLYIRNTETTSNFACETLSVTITKS